MEYVMIWSDQDAHISVWKSKDGSRIQICGPDGEVISEALLN